jgi:5-methylcytosine-specific restriction endonuclease McrA
VNKSKACTSCRESKDPSEFHRSPQRPDGLYPYCKVCRSAMARGRNPRRPDPSKPVAGPGEKVCPRCRNSKKLASFPKHCGYKDGHHPYCRERKAKSDAASHTRHRDRRNAAARESYRTQPGPYKERALAAYHADRELVKQRATTWAVANPERRREIRLASARRRYVLDPERKREVWRRRQAAIRRGCVVFPFTVEQLAAKVAYWGGRCWVCGVPYEAIDHVKPLARLGPHMLANLRPICSPCNTRKRDRWPLAG